MDSWEPDPERVVDLASLSAELQKLHLRSRKGSGPARGSYADLAKRMGLPATSRSTVWGYMSGRSLPPPDVLDAIVIALGATDEELPRWGNAWFQAEAGRRSGNKARAIGPDESDVESAEKELLTRTRKTNDLDGDVCSVTAHNIDLVYQVGTIAPDHEEEVSLPLIKPGGSGANTAVALAVLGMRVAAMGAIGGDWRGHMLRTSLLDAGLDCEWILQGSREHKSGNTQIYTDSSGGRLIYVDPGFNRMFSAELRARDPSGEVFAYLQKFRWIHMSSFSSAPERLLQEAFARSLSASQILSITPGSLYSSLGADLLSELLSRANAIFLYEVHLDSLLENSSAPSIPRGSRVVDKIACLLAWRARQAKNLQPVLIAVKRPVELARGRVHEYLTVATGRREIENVARPDVSLRSRKVIDATGAGDALAAGIIAGLLRGASLQESVDAAFVMAMLASSEVGPRTALEANTSSGLTRMVKEYFPSNHLNVVLARSRE